jgi:hypothetical protein
MSTRHLQYARPGGELGGAGRDVFSKFFVDFFNYIGTGNSDKIILNLLSTKISEFCCFWKERKLLFS